MHKNKQHHLLYTKTYFSVLSLKVKISQSLGNITCYILYHFKLVQNLIRSKLRFNMELLLYMAIESKEMYLLCCEVL